MKKIILLSLALSGLAVAQTGEGLPKPPGPIGDPAGSGAYPAIAEARADYADHTFYHPAKLPAKLLPLVLWGNGGCRDNGLSASHFLREVASHGYFIITAGAPRSEYPVRASAPIMTAPAPPVTPPKEVRADQTSPAQIIDAIGWATRANADKASPFYKHIDTSRIAMMGHSCGGLQTVVVAADPRVDTAILFDSGVLNDARVGQSALQVKKDALLKLHTPVAYVIGGPADIAYPNAVDDYGRIAHVPVFMANMPVGHGGTFNLANGGEWAQFGVNWLNWQLKGDRKAATWFIGEKCGLCTDARWTVQRKNFNWAKAR
jgi:uncharacterized protein